MIQYHRGVLAFLVSPAGAPGRRAFPGGNWRWCADTVEGKDFPYFTEVIKWTLRTRPCITMQMTRSQETGYLILL
nr:MAG TPA: hypothetical protein [Caudoviricetes sp.]